MDEFEQHFFSCPECAEEVRWLAIFEDNARRAAKHSDAVPAMLIDLAAGAEAGLEAVRAPLGSQPVVLVLPPGEWTALELVSAVGGMRFAVALDPPGRAVVIPARELTAGQYRVEAEAREGVRRGFVFHVG